MTPLIQQPTTKKPRRKPESLRVRDVSPSLTVSNLEKSLVFYRDVLGFIVDEKWEHEGKVTGVSLKAGMATLMISQDDWKKGKTRVKGEGIRLYLSTTQDINEIANSVKARGGKLASEPEDTPWETRVFTVVDPDGYKFTIASGG